MKVVIVEPGKPGYVKDIEDKLENLQQIVGGYIEAITLKPGVVLVCNEEGKIKGLPINRDIGFDYICGTFFICGTKGEDFASLNDIQVETYLNAFSGTQ